MPLIPKKRDELQKKLDGLRREGEERLSMQKAEKSGYAYVDLRKTPASPQAIAVLPESEARSAMVAVVQAKRKKIAVVAYDPESDRAKQVFAKLKQRGFEAEIFVASLTGLSGAWELYKLIPHAAARAIVGRIIIPKNRAEELKEKTSSLANLVAAVSSFDFRELETTELETLLLTGAILNRASDIHLESEEDGGKIRYRIDGELYDIFSPVPLKNFRALISRIKLVAELKINVTNEPQDGRLTVSLPEKEIEVRTSAIPAEFGETVVMRILDPDAIHIELSGLGLRRDDEELVQRELEKPNGMILNTGPTGSGKTTTLYAFLRFVNKSNVKIITVEDPIEYHLDGVEQTQVDEKAGYTFAGGLRSILRQDPDIILVGEIRDRETADTAMQAALTGHLVFSTLHANDAAGATPRLINLGVGAATIGPALNIVIAQRLVRVLCVACRAQTKIDETLKARIQKRLSSLPERVNKKDYESWTIYDAKGCEKCSGLGFRGRIAIYEFLKAGEDFEKTVLRDSSEQAMRELIKTQGMVTMQEDGILKVLKGITTFDEVKKATGPILW